uniref:Uncharacterized protein n=1 Tax=Megaviridae environmental sample TaxID=1737588 RepID=A0A5J6VJV4_9VIRU|nr:MAG: hypothetical protein [Megaviridae environmental sample]
MYNLKLYYIFTILILYFLIIHTLKKNNKIKEQLTTTNNSNRFLLNHILKTNSENNIKILYIVGVENSIRNIALLENNYEILKNKHSLDWCFNHFDGDNSLWKNEKWYDNLNCTKNTKKGTKVIQWLNITPEIALDYDYLWFVDGDIGLEKFNYDSYYKMLDKFKPLLSQPSVASHTLLGKSSDWPHLRYEHQFRNTIHICDKNIEVQTPFISTKVWNLIYEKLKLTNPISIWETELFYNNLIYDLNQIKFINFTSAVIHHDFKNLTSNNKDLKKARMLYKSPDPDNYDEKVLAIKKIL